MSSVHDGNDDRAGRRPRRAHTEPPPEHAWLDSASFLEGVGVSEAPMDSLPDEVVRGFRLDSGPKAAADGRGAPGGRERP